MPLATRRMDRAPVNGPAQVARTATTDATAVVVGSSMIDPFIDFVLLTLLTRSKREADRAPQTRTSADTRVGHR